MSRFLKGSKGHPAPLRQKAQVRIATERPLMAELAQEVTQSRMILQIPRRQVRWQPLDLEGPRCRALLERPLQHGLKRGGISLRPYPQPVIEIALRAKVLRRDEHTPAGPERPRQRDGPVGRVAVEGDMDSGRNPLERGDDFKLESVDE